MKILKLLTGSVAAVALVSGSALAQTVNVLTDSQGLPVRDSQGQCVLTSGIPHPDCQPKKDAPAPKPAAPAAPGAPAAPATPAAPAAKAAPASVAWR
jgi:2-oxoglutarate dehydrogenase E2 component (dihydrolipoamide succinyltransferase)